MFVIFVTFYLIIDIKLESTSLKLYSKDLKVMKIIHDLKNPVQAILSVINDSKLDPNYMRSIANADLEDINEMLDNLKAEFKSRHNMECKEDEREIKTVEFLENISRSHIRLANNGNNTFEIATDDSIPDVIKIKKITVSRICNNLISNSLKHTHCGNVNLVFRVSNDSDFTDKEFRQKGAPYDDKKR